MFGQGATEREATVDLRRGLFLLRYVSGAAFGPAPVAVARAERESESFIDVISPPGVAAGFLAVPGACVVVRAERPGRLTLKVMAGAPGASLDASFRLDPVGAEPGAEASAREPAPGFAPIGGEGPALQILAHVARRGDILVEPGQWAGGPQAPAAIEGVEIRCSAPGGGVAAQPLIATDPPRWLDWAAAGAFAGTRARALPLAGLRLKLVGAVAAQFVLHAEALFLGGPVVTKRGREIELVGSCASDPLVGLRLELISAAAERRSLPAVPEPITREARSEPRVRVFRAAAGA